MQFRHRFGNPNRNPRCFQKVFQYLKYPYTLDAHREEVFDAPFHTGPTIFRRGISTHTTGGVAVSAPAACFGALAVLMAATGWLSARHSRASYGCERSPCRQPRWIDRCLSRHLRRFRLLRCAANSRKRGAAEWHFQKPICPWQRRLIQCSQPALASQASADRHRMTPIAQEERERHRQSKAARESMAADRRHEKVLESSQLRLRSERKRRSNAASTRMDQMVRTKGEVDALRCATEEGERRGFSG
jgi:hypothetical protein